jgi:hypothetical protein
MRPDEMQMLRSCFVLPADRCSCSCMHCIHGRLLHSIYCSGPRHLRWCAARASLDRLELASDRLTSALDRITARSGRDRQGRRRHVRTQRQRLASRCCSLQLADRPSNARPLDNHALHRLVCAVVRSKSSAPCYFSAHIRAHVVGQPAK